MATKKNGNKKHRLVNFPEPNTIIDGNFLYCVDNNDNYNEDKETGTLELIPDYFDEHPYYYHQSPKFDKDKFTESLLNNYKKKINFSALAKYKNIENLTLKQFSNIDDFSGLKSIAKLQFLAIWYDWIAHDEIYKEMDHALIPEAYEEKFLYPKYNLKTFPLMKNLKVFNCSVPILEKFDLISIVQNMPNLEILCIRINICEFVDPPSASSDYQNTDIDLCILLELKKLKILEIFFYGSLDLHFANHPEFFQKLGTIKSPLIELKIIEQDSLGLDTYLETEKEINYTADIFNNFLGITKIKTLEKLTMNFEYQNREDGQALSFMTALSKMPSLKQFDANWVDWIPYKPGVQLNKEVDQIKCNIIGQFSKLERISSLPSLEQNSINVFSKMKSLKTIDKPLKITNCTDLKKVCDLLKNIECKEITIDIEDKSAIDFTELSKLNCLFLSVNFVHKQIKSLEGIEINTKISRLRIIGVENVLDLEPLRYLGQLNSVMLMGSISKKRKKILNKYTGGIFTILKHHNQLVITDFEKKSKKII